MATVYIYVYIIIIVITIIIITIMLMPVSGHSCLNLWACVTLRINYPEHPKP